jgi:hypothetical protein
MKYEQMLPHQELLAKSESLLQQMLSNEKQLRTEIIRLEALIANLKLRIHLIKTQNEETV